jgi:hypothetical protein
MIDVGIEDHTGLEPLDIRNDPRPTLGGKKIIFGLSNIVQDN